MAVEESRGDRRGVVGLLVETVIVSADVVGNEHSNDETIDGNDTSHDNRNNALHDELGSHHGHR